MDENTKIDNIDWKILGILSQNARASTVKIARIIGITREVVKYRIDRMEKGGIISKYIILTDNSRLGFPIWGYMHIRFKGISIKRERELIDYAKREPLVAFAYSNMGSWDFGMEFMAESPRHFYLLQRQVVERFSDIIKDFETGSFVDVHKMNFVPFKISIIKK